MSTERDTKRPTRRLALLELDLDDLLRAPELGEHMLREMPPIPLNQGSPLRGDDRHFGTVHLRIDRYPVDQVTKYRLMLATLKTGVVGRTSRGWLLLRDAHPPVFREATTEEVAALPHLPDDWERFLVDVG
jgi:hypothetical protein